MKLTWTKCSDLSDSHPPLPLSAHSNQTGCPFKGKSTSSSLFPCALDVFVPLLQQSILLYQKAFPFLQKSCAHAHKHTYTPISDEVLIKLLIVGIVTSSVFLSV